MAYQLSDLISEVQRRAKDSSFDSSLITDYLNDIQQEILGSRMLSFQETSVSATLSISDTTYTYPSNLQTIVGLRLTDPTTATIYFNPEYLPHREFFDLYPTPTVYAASSPIAYTDFGRVLLWDRPLDKAYPLYLRYIKKVPTLDEAADVPLIPEEFKGILVRGALASIEEYRDNFDIAAVHRRKVEDLVENMVVRYSRRDLTKLGGGGSNKARIIK